MSQHKHALTAAKERAPRLRFENHEQQPVKFFIDSDSSRSRALILDGPGGPRIRLTDNKAAEYKRFITQYGGVVLARGEEENADVIIVESTMKDDYLQYYAARNSPTIVETPKFLKRCREKGIYEHGVQKINKKRTPFTEEERQMLFKYIAQRIPKSTTPGRSGNKIYEQLMEYAKKNPRGPWALTTRHTWQSWRNHYDKNKAKFDPIIDKIAENGTAFAGETYTMGRRKNTQHVSRELESDIEEGLNAIDEMVEEEDEPPVLRFRRRARPVNDDDDYILGRSDGESDRPPARKRRRVEPQVHSRMDDISDWEEGFVPNGRTTRDTSEIHPGPDDAGPSGTQRTPSPVPLQSRNSTPTPPPHLKPPKPRPRARVARASTPLNTQQTLVNSSSPAKTDEQLSQSDDASNHVVSKAKEGPPELPIRHLPRRPAPRRQWRQVYVDLRRRPTRANLLRLAANAHSEPEAPSLETHPAVGDDADSGDEDGATGAVDGEEEDAGEEEAMANDAHGSGLGSDDERSAGWLVAEVKEDTEGHPFDADDGDSDGD